MKLATYALVLLTSLLLGCSEKSSLTSNQTVSGAYDIIVTSNVTGAVTLVEANFSANANQSVAQGPTQVQILTLEKKIWYVNGSCPGSAPGQNGVTANINGNEVSLTFDEGGNTFGGPGAFTGTTINGSFSVTGSDCPDLVGVVGVYPPGYDQGGFVGNPVAALAGTFEGTLNLPSGADNAAFTLSEGGDKSLTVTAQLTGADNGTFTFTGSAIGNSMFVSGTIGAQSVTFLGYYDRQGTFDGYPGSLLVFNDVTQAISGVLLQQ